MSARPRYTTTVSSDHRVTVTAADGDIDLRPKERALVLALALHAPEPVEIREVIGSLWPDGPPATARQSVHNHLARLRKVAPGLIATSRRGYTLEGGVDIAGAGWADIEHGAATDRFGAAVLPRFGRVDAHDRPRPVDGRDHGRRATDAGTGAIRTRLATEPFDQLLASLEHAVEERPTDERRWWDLMVALAVADRPEAVRAALDRAETALADVGLEPGRRLVDIDRLARRGVTDIDRLTADPFGRAHDAVDARCRLSDRDLESVRALMRSESPFVIEVVAPRSAARSDLLARLVNEARIHGFEAVTVRVPTTLSIPPEPRVPWSTTRPPLIAVDDAERSDDVAGLVERLRRPREHPADDRVDRGIHRVGGLHLASVVITSEPSEASDRSIEGFETSLRVVAEQRAGPDRSRIDAADLPTTTVELAEILAVLDEPVSDTEIGRVIDGVGAALRTGLRHQLLRFDVRTSRIDLAGHVERGHLLDRLTDDRRRAIAHRLLGLELGHESDAHRATRRARLALIAFGAASVEALDATRDAIDTCRRAGELASAITLARHAMASIEAVAGRTTSWCHLGVLLGHLELATGNPHGDAVLLDTIDAARLLGDDEVLSLATHELCRLGRAATAGRADPRSAALISTMLDDVSGPANRARVGAAAAMVYSFVGEPERLRSIYESAEADARAADDPELLVDVLPHTYMSLPLPGDVGRRFANARELIELGERYQRPEATWEGLHLQLATEVMTATGDPRATYRLLDAASSLLHERTREWEMHYVRSDIALLDGDLDEARRQVDESLAFAANVNESRVSAVFGAHHLSIALIGGGVGGFLDVTRQLVVDQPDIAAWRAALTLAAADAGEVDEACAVFDTLMEAGGRAWPPDHTYAPALVCLGEAAVMLGHDGRRRYALELLEPLAGTWSWTGSCTFGPIDLTVARLQMALGHTDAARRSAAAAVRSSAALRAPRYVSAATSILLEID